MYREDIIKDLETLKESLNEVNKINEQLIDENNVEDYFENKLVKPLEVIKPVSPSSNSASNKQNNNLKIKRILNRFGIAMVISYLVFLIASIILLKLYAEKNIYVGFYYPNGSEGLVGFRIGYFFRNILCSIIFPLVFIVLIIVNVVLDKTSKGKENNEIKKVEEKYRNYEIKLQNYYEDYFKYLKAKETYDNNYQIEKEKALIKIELLNKETKEKANDIIKKAKESISIDYPENYYNRIDDILNILKSSRADDLKEAISILLDDDYKAEMLAQQRRYNDELIRQGEEQKRMLQEQAEREERHHREQMRLQAQLAKEAEDRATEEKRNANRQARLQCSNCKNNFGCPVKETISGPCPNHVSNL